MVKRSATKGESVSTNFKYSRLIGHMVDKRLLVSALLIPLFILIYSIVTKLNIISVIESIRPMVILSFVAAYLTQVTTLSIRDVIITRMVGSVKLKLTTTLRARLAGNAVGLVIPGWIGPDLSRALRYSKDGMRLQEALSASLSEAFYDVMGMCVMFVALFFILAHEPIYIPFLLISLGNIAGWITAFVYFQANSQLNWLEAKAIQLMPYKTVISKIYEAVKGNFTKPIAKVKYFLSLLALTSLGWTMNVLPFWYYTDSPRMALFAGFLYFVSGLIPIPASAVGVPEVSLSLLLPARVVVQIVVMETVSIALGLLFLHEINLSELKKIAKEIEK